jgi:hypothetical protein
VRPKSRKVNKTNEYKQQEQNRTPRKKGKGRNNKKEQKRKKGKEGRRKVLSLSFIMENARIKRALASPRETKCVCLSVFLVTGAAFRDTLDTKTKEARGSEKTYSVMIYRHSNLLSVR